jgi:hypothetical protein
MNKQEVIDSFKMLGTKSIENYSQDLMKALFDKYSSPNFVSNLFQQDKDHFIALARYWP